MTLKVFITLMIGVVFLIFAYIIMKGKGDKFIAGYNTASEEEKAQVNIKRLRILVALTSVLAGVFCCIVPLLADNNGAIVGATVVLLCSGLAVVVLANTWARKK
jgi:hypothetical protein